MIGVVKSYDRRRGMGALAPDGGGPDIAVFVSEVERAGFATLTPGERLTFTVQADKLLGRKHAVNLRAFGPGEER